jgi:hypothetical protein
MPTPEITMFNPTATSPTGLPQFSPWMSYPNVNNFPGLAFGGDMFKQGMATAAPTGGIRPDTQKVLDYITQQGETLRAKNVSDAQALATRRGIAGSSTEQFGVQQAAKAADEATINAKTSTLLQGVQNDEAMRQLQAQALFQRSGLEAQLTSDELASLRNMDYANQSLKIQQMLAERGLAISEENIQAMRDAANQQSKDSMISSLISAFGPAALYGKMGFGGGQPGGGGGWGNLLPFSGMTGGNGATAVALKTTGAPASRLFPGGLGQVGTNQPGMLSSWFGPGGTLFNTAGTSTFGAHPFANAGMGYLGYQGARAAGTNATQKWDQLGMNLGAIGGTVVGSYFGPLGAAAGGLIGTINGKAAARLARGTYNVGKDLLKGNVSAAGNRVVNNVSKSIKKVFPF